MRNDLHLLLTAFAIVLATILFFEWRSERRDRAQLQSTLDAAQQSLQRATAAQQDRDRQLTDTVAKLESLKSTVRTQQQILAQLPSLIPLPKPIEATSQLQSNTRNALPDSPSAKPQAQSTGATIPPEDLKPLYDFAVDCRACQAKLATATADLVDERSKTQALSRERDAALQLARGGSLRQRFTRALKWFVLGAAAGAVAAKH